MPKSWNRFGRNVCEITAFWPFKKKKKNDQCIHFQFDFNWADCVSFFFNQTESENWMISWAESHAQSSTEWHSDLIWLIAQIIWFNVYISVLFSKSLFFISSKWIVVISIYPIMMINWLFIRILIKRWSKCQFIKVKLMESYVQKWKNCRCVLRQLMMKYYGIFLYTVKSSKMISLDRNKRPPNTDLLSKIIYMVFFLSSVVLSLCYFYLLFLQFRGIGGLCVWP